MSSEHESDETDAGDGSRVSFRVGESFESFQQLVKRFEKATSTKLWIRDSRTVESARKRTVANGDMCRMADPTFEPYGGVTPWWVGSLGDACAKNLEKFPA